MVAECENMNKSQTKTKFPNIAVALGNLLEKAGLEGLAKESSGNVKKLVLTFKFIGKVLSNLCHNIFHARKVLFNLACVVPYFGENTEGKDH